MSNDENRRIYERYIELINAQEYAALPEVVDTAKYREICVGFTPGWVDLPEAVSSLKQVVEGIPDLNARIEDSVAEDDKVYARLTVTGTNSGSFYGIPATGRSYEVSMFDYARIEDGKIVERVQQSDTFSQLRQMYAGAAKKTAFTALTALAAVVVFRFLRRRKRA